MNAIINFIFENAHIAHYIIFGSLILAGLNIPISEDLMIILSAVIASTIIPKNTYILFFSVFLGAYISDWMVYWIGRLIGIRLWNYKWFKKTVPKKTLSKIKLFYKKYGVYTLLIGRFIPFGVRNCLFLTAGMSKMNFIKFIICDGIACLLSNFVLFYIAFSASKNYDTIFSTLKKANLIIFVCFIVTLIIIFCYYKNKKKKSKC
ncbi:MAG: Inner membrane protein [Candidatus Anoxychlamydiales bacterium]|nr:Inner membrane protein [Candidatus Anoxychlamydiales bacterium]